MVYQKKDRISVKSASRNKYARQNTLVHAGRNEKVCFKLYIIGISLLGFILSRRFFRSFFIACWIDRFLSFRPVPQMGNRPVQIARGNKSFFVHVDAVEIFLDPRRGFILSEFSVVVIVEVLEKPGNSLLKCTSGREPWIIHHGGSCGRSKTLPAKPADRPCPLRAGAGQNGMQ